MEGSLELRPVVGLDDLDPEGKPVQDIVDELDGRLLVEPVVDPEDPETSAAVDSRELIVPPPGSLEGGR